MSPVALITGAAGNLGRGVVAAMVGRGYRVVLFDRTTERLEAMYPELRDDPEHLLVGEVDLTEREAVRAAVDDAVGRSGRLDALIHTVGMFKGDTTVASTTPELITTLLSVNVLTTLWCCQAVLPHLGAQGRGAIVNVASTAALAGEFGLAAYSATKSAVVRLTESLAREVGPSGINVNAVLPATMDTPRNREMMPAEKFVSIGAVAEAIAFLATEAGRGVHGLALPVLGRGA